MSYFYDSKLSGHNQYYVKGWRILKFDKEYIKEFSSVVLKFLKYKYQYKMEINSEQQQIDINTRKLL